MKRTIIKTLVCCSMLALFTGCANKEDSKSTSSASNQVAASSANEEELKKLLIKAIQPKDNLDSGMTMEITVPADAKQLEFEYLQLTDEHTWEKLTQIELDTKDLKTSSVTIHLDVQTEEDTDSPDEVTSSLEFVKADQEISGDIARKSGINIVSNVTFSTLGFFVNTEGYLTEITEEMNEQIPLMLYCGYPESTLGKAVGNSISSFSHPEDIMDTSAAFVFTVTCKN